MNKSRLTRKIYFSVLLIFLCVVSRGQSTTSPYSVFGPGELQPRGFGKSLGFGGTGIGVRSGDFLNNMNPASYFSLDSMRFIYEMGFEAKRSSFSSQGEKMKDMAYNFKYVAMGFRVTKWWANSVGIAPFSNVGYNVKARSYVEGVNLEFESTLEGSGGISQAYWGNAFHYKNLSLGANASYLFGSIIQEETVSTRDVLVSDFYIDRTDYMKSFYFDFGLQYAIKSKKWDYTLGAVYSPEQRLTSRHEISLYNNSRTLQSTYEEDSKKLKVPEKIGVGFSMKKGVFLHLAADYELQKWSGIKYPSQVDGFENSQRFSVGLESKPWGDGINHDWYKKIVYRCGLNYETSFLKLDGVQIDKKGLAFGIGIPSRSTGTVLNFSFELGSKGTISTRLIRENYVLFHMNFTLNEKWFTKRIFY